MFLNIAFDFDKIMDSSWIMFNECSNSRARDCSVLSLSTSLLVSAMERWCSKIEKNTPLPSTGTDKEFLNSGMYKLESAVTFKKKLKVCEQINVLVLLTVSYS